MPLTVPRLRPLGFHPHISRKRSKSGPILFLLVGFHFACFHDLERGCLGLKCRDRPESPLLATALL